MTDTETIAADESTNVEDRAPRWMMAIGGAVGLLASTVLTLDKIEQLKNPDTTFSCDINAFVSCAGVMSSEQSEAFGFANSIFGAIGFAVVLTLGVLLVARVRLPEFVWAGMQVGVLFGIGFVTWLQFQSIYRLDKLCPYCMVVWAVMIPLFVVVTARNLRTWMPGGAISRFVDNWQVLIVALWYIGIIAAIWFHFGDRLWA